MAGEGHDFCRKRRLRKRPEFLEVYARGKRYTGVGITIFYKSNNLGVSRIGLDISRKVGNAVKRNRYKRLLREVFRQYRSRLAADYDLVIRVHPGSETLDYRNILREFLNFADKTAGWKNN